MLNLQLLLTILSSKLDEIIQTGKAPDGLKIINDSTALSPYQFDSSASRVIHLTPSSPIEAPGIAVNKVSVSLTYKGVEFILTEK